MKSERDAKVSILTFLHFSLRQMRRLAHLLLALHQHLRAEGGTTKEAAGRQPTRDASAVPFCPRPQATYLIDIANTSALNCLLKHLNEKPFSARKAHIHVSYTPTVSLLIHCLHKSQSATTLYVCVKPTREGMKYFKELRRHLG